MAQCTTLLTVKRIDTALDDYLRRVGSICEVFDQQDSGCVSYGVLAAPGKVFVKYSEEPAAVRQLHKSIAFYQDVSHPGLPKLLNWFETSAGLALVFGWIDGEILYSPRYGGAEGRNNPASAHYRFRQLPVETIIAALNTVYDVHAYLEHKGYVAVDFYDGCMIYDFFSGRLRLCDFDYYHRGPMYLDRERNFGSSRFMAPEEFVKGSLIDATTNVYTMGATAFVFLADLSRDPAHWRGTPEQYSVCLKAVSRDRSARYATVIDFYRDWLEASRLSS